MSVEDPFEDVYQSIQSAIDHLRVAKRVLSKLEFRGEADSRSRQLNTKVDLIIDDLLGEVPLGCSDLSCLEALNDRVDLGGEDREWVFS